MTNSRPTLRGERRLDIPRRTRPRDPLLPISGAASLLGVSTDVVATLAEEGALTYVHVGTSNHRYFRTSDVVKHRNTEIVREFIDGSRGGEG